MLFFQNQFVQIIFSSVVIYIFIVLAIRIFGKKEISQLSVMDLVFILLISNSVQNAMVGSNTTLLGGLSAAASLFLVNYLFKQFIFKYPKLGNLIQGESIMLIYDGKLASQSLAKARISMDELMEALREHGVSSIEEVNLAVLEVNGSISVLSDQFQRKTIKKRKIG